MGEKGAKQTGRDKSMGDDFTDLILVTLIVCKQSPLLH